MDSIIETMKPLPYPRKRGHKASSWWLGLFAPAALLVGLISCAGVTESQMTVSVSIPPQAYFVEQIAGENIQINFIVPVNRADQNRLQQFGIAGGHFHLYVKAAALKDFLV